MQRVSLQRKYRRRWRETSTRLPRVAKIQAADQVPFARRNEDLASETEGAYLQEQGKRMKLIDEDLFFTIEEKSNQVDLTGRESI